MKKFSIDVKASGPKDKLYNLQLTEDEMYHLKEFMGSWVGYFSNIIKNKIKDLQK